MSTKENKSTELKKTSQNKEETDPYYKEKAIRVSLSVTLRE